MEKIKQRAEAGGAGEPGRAAVFNRTVGGGSPDIPRGYLGKAFQAVGASAKALRLEHLCAYSHVGTPPRLELSCTQMLTGPAAGPGQQHSRSESTQGRRPSATPTPGYRPYKEEPQREKKAQGLRWSRGE